MAAPRALPSALEPYLHSASDGSLNLLTGTLGSTVSWLTNRYIANAFRPDRDEDRTESAVVLVSWMRDASFWKNEMRRATGLDISRFAQAGRFTFVDCFSNPTMTLAEVQKNATSALDYMSKPTQDDHPKKITLVLDAPDILLASTSTTAAALSRLLLTLRSHDNVDSTVISISADLPLLSAAVPDSGDHSATPIEVATAAFVTTQAHSARWLLSVRGLDTGAATDVSGVLRATRGGDHDTEDTSTKECELLYLLNRDGSVKVFKRGSSGL
ncbi:hypothetical protein TI39_contig4222g00001 [Zymoseptoria brevis]|uniref:Elongator complex protein 5 n=1 Tax=Zymoseptoria brevis TaxID=1047168 RepID=A0A0F4GAL5_9PEZI|nr:hypothetical protein TI39_contig4222g00001 [Zymoseptoria brevis]